MFIALLTVTITNSRNDCHASQTETYCMLLSLLILDTDISLHYSLYSHYCNLYSITRLPIQITSIIPYSIIHQCTLFSINFAELRAGASKHGTVQCDIYSIDTCQIMQACITQAQASNFNMHFYAILKSYTIYIELPRYII